MACIYPEMLTLCLQVVLANLSIAPFLLQNDTYYMLAFLSATFHAKIIEKDCQSLNNAEVTLLFANCTCLIVSLTAST